MADRLSLGIRARISGVIAVVAGLGVIVVAVVTIGVVRSSAEAELRQLGLDAARSGFALPSDIGIPVIVSGGGVVATGDPLATDLARTVVGGHPMSGDSVVIVSGATSGFSTSVPFTGPDGPVSLTALTATGGLDQAVGALRRIFWIGGPLLVLFVTGAGWLLTGAALRPVTKIVDRARRITMSNLEQRVPVPGANDEIAQVAVTVNRMLDRLEAGSVRQTQFVSDASHELRSPLTALMGEVEIALAHPDDSNWLAVASRVQAQGARINVLVDELLTVAAQAEGSPRQTTRVNMADVVAEEAEFCPVPVHTSGCDDAHVEGETAALASAVRNLLVNAARHATGRVEATTAWANDRVVVTVDDDGPGVPIADRRRIFERFTRLDQARTREDGGTGLGLAIAQAIASRHGGSCWVSTSHLGGACFHLELPAAGIAVVRASTFE